MDNKSNLFGVIFLILILLLFIFGGFYLMKYVTNESVDNDNNRVSESIKIDDTKDYIYYKSNEEIIGEIEDIDITINIKGLDSLTYELNNETDELQSIKSYYTNQELPDGIECENNLYSFKYRTYEDVSYNNYLSLIINDYEYTCGVGSKIINIKSIVIDKLTGSIIENDTLLSNFNVTEDMIKESVSTRINNTQVLDESEEVIDIDSTINELVNGSYNVSKGLSVSKNGKLMINFIVISNKINYNDSVEID